MRQDVEEGFVHLAQDARAPGNSQLLSRPIGPPALGAQLAVGADGNRHLLVPLDDEVSAPTRRGAAVTLAPRELDTAPVSAWLDLACRRTELGLVFEQLVTDALERSSRVGRDDVPATIATTLDEWRELLAAASRGIDRELVVGLHGELSVLTALAEQGDPVSVLDTWAGPSGGLHDFRSESKSIEVKATASNDGNFVTISSLDQLDPQEAGRLYLAALHLRERPDAPSLDDRIRDLLALDMPRTQLLKAVAAYGYVFESAADHEHRFHVRSRRWWLVDDTFPGLRRSAIDATRRRGLSRIRYVLALDSCGAPLNEESTQSLLSDWT